MVSRYGVTIRKKEEGIKKQVRQKYACHSCGKKRVKRISFALWKCKSCGATFAGAAYSPESTLGASVGKQFSA